MFPSYTNLFNPLFYHPISWGYLSLRGQAGTGVLWISCRHLDGNKLFQNTIIAALAFW